MRDAGPESPASASRPPVRPSRATTLQPRGHGPVSFVERRADGDVEWAVFEMDARDVAGAPRERCLVFWREACLRRVWDYPEDWRALGAAGLAALSRHR